MVRFAVNGRQAQHDESTNLHRQHPHRVPTCSVAPASGTVLFQGPGTGPSQMHTFVAHLASQGFKTVCPLVVDKCWLHSCRQTILDESATNSMRWVCFVLMILLVDCLCMFLHGLPCIHNTDMTMHRHAAHLDYAVRCCIALQHAQLQTGMQMCTHRVHIYCRH